MKPMSRFLKAAAVAMALTFAAASYAATVNLKADLKASSEVPPKDSAGSGTLTRTLNTDTDEFKYHVQFTALTGPVVAAHFHGHAVEGANAKPQVPIKGSPVTSPIGGTVTLTLEQAKDLQDGKWYFNLHTQANPGERSEARYRRFNESLRQSSANSYAATPQFLHRRDILGQLPATA